MAAITQMRKIPRDDSFDFMSTPPASPSPSPVAQSPHHSLTGSGGREPNFPFLRADHSFDASTLSNPSSARNPASICLSFGAGDPVYVHFRHESGWADVRQLRTSARGWVPLNYFSAFADARAIPLLSAAANFVASPYTYRPHASTVDRSDRNDSKGSADSRSFSQGAINEIIGGVRSALASTGTLNRDSAVTRRSPEVHRARKALLTELAQVVLVAKQNKKSTDPSVTEKLVRGVLRTVHKTIVLLDAYSADSNQFGPASPTEPSSRTVSGASLATDFSEDGDVMDTAERLHSNSPRPTSPSPDKPRMDIMAEPSVESAVPKKLSRPRSFEDHPRVPTPQARLDEVLAALGHYTRFFSEDDGYMAYHNPLEVTRRCMVASRELLAVVDAASLSNPAEAQTFQFTPSPVSSEEARYLEDLKDALYREMRRLLTATRTVVAGSSAANPRAQQKLGEVARECMELALQCGKRTYVLLEANPDIELPQDRDYPCFYSDIARASSWEASAAIRDESHDESRTALPDESGNKANDETVAGDDDDAGDVTLNDDSVDFVGAKEDPASNQTPEPHAVLAVKPTLSQAHQAHNDSQNMLRASREPTLVGDTEIDSHERISEVSTVSTVSLPAFSGAGVTFSEVEANPTDEYPIKFKLPFTPKPVPQPTESVVDPVSPPVDGQPPTPQGEPTEMVYRSGRVRGGTVRALVAWLATPEATDFTLSAFLLTFRLFTDPQQVALGLAAQSSPAAQEKAVHIARLWIESWWRSGDEVALPVLGTLIHDEDLVSRRRTHDIRSQLISRPLEHAAIPSGRSSSTSLPHTERPFQPRQSSTTSMLSLMSSRRSSRRVSHDDLKSLGMAWGSAFKFTTAPADMTPSARADAAALRLLDYDVTDIAVQLTLMAVDVFVALKPDELLDQRFSVNKKGLGLAPHVAQLVLATNHLTAFVGDTVLGSEQFNMKTRTRILKMWLKVANELHQLGNLNAMVAILLALQSGKITRLRRIWDALSPKTSQIMQRLGGLTSPERNFSGYRREQRQREGTPCIPYIGLFLSDLTLLDEGNAKTLPPPAGCPPDEVVINFDRYMRTAQVIAHLQRFQQNVPHGFVESSSIQSWLRSAMAKSYSMASRDSDEQWRRSCVIEP